MAIKTKMVVLALIAGKEEIITVVEAEQQVGWCGYLMQFEGDSPELRFDCFTEMKGIYVSEYGDNVRFEFSHTDDSAILKPVNKCPKCNAKGRFKKRARYNPFMPVYSQDEWDWYWCDCEFGKTKMDEENAKNQLKWLQLVNDVKNGKKSIWEVDSFIQDDVCMDAFNKTLMQYEHDFQVEKSKIKGLSLLESGDAVKVILTYVKSSWTPYGQQDAYKADNGKNYRTIKFDLPENTPIAIVANRGVVKEWHYC